MEYSGNEIYKYVHDEGLDYYYSAEHTWMLVYGNAASIPKILVFVSKVSDIGQSYSTEEKNDANKAFLIAKYLKLPFLFVRFMVNSEAVVIWEGNKREWRKLTYSQLRDLYERYGVVKPGTAKKRVNQYLSSPYHDWQRRNLGRITVSDFDLIKYVDGEVKEIIELKRSKISPNVWKPYIKDYPNFALLINTIVGSGKSIPLTLFYNLMRDGQRGMREEDISRIKVYDFVIPSSIISSKQVKYRFRDFFTLNQLLTR